MNILLAEDDRSQRTLLSRQLIEWGHQVFEVENGQKALDILSSNKSIHVLISDFQMPGMNGLELISELQEKKILLPLNILFSGTNLSNEVKELRKMLNRDQALHFISKDRGIGAIQFYLDVEG